MNRYNRFMDVRYMDEELARLFNLTSNNETIKYKNVDCGGLAQEILSPEKKGGYISHYTYNYRKYTQLTINKRPEVPLLVVRTEFLWKDASNIEIALRGNESNFLDKQLTWSHGSENFAVKAKLETDIQRQAVCCTIYDDLQVYQDIVMRALNLDYYEKRKMIAMIHRDCSVNIYEHESIVLYGTKFWEQWFATTCNGGG
eukprot:scaffold39177_cov38-Cyclotella_meneghiniana.AAC.2